MRKTHKMQTILTKVICEAKVKAGFVVGLSGNSPMETHDPPLSQSMKLPPRQPSPNATKTNGDLLQGYEITFKRAV